MNDFIFLCKEIWKGKSITRSYLNLRLSKETLKGKTIDIGGGKDPDYIVCMKRQEVELVNFDMKTGAAVDFETDTLPALDGTYDTVLFLNVLEHIFNHQHIANELVRILKPEGTLIGFVPFLMWYHPDHRDFFRYTDEALSIIFSKADAAKIQIAPISKGPFTAALQMISAWLPRPLTVLLFIPTYAIDTLFQKLRPVHAKRYALGYYFTLSK